MSSNPTVVPSASFNGEGRSVPTGNGWAWLADAWTLFRGAAGTWIGMGVVLALIFVVLAVVPILGPLASFILGPVFTAGLVIAGRTAAEGGEPRFAQLFDGFRHRFGTLAAVGALYLVGTVAIMLVVSLLTGVGLFGMMGSSTPPDTLAALGGRLAIAILLMLALMVPLVMALWFAPPLVVFNDLGAVESMKASFAGCLKNILPFLFYGLVLLIASVVASLPFMLGWLILGPVMGASIYTAYRDIYFTP